VIRRQHGDAVELREQRQQQRVDVDAAQHVLAPHVGALQERVEEAHAEGLVAERYERREERAERDGHALRERRGSEQR
jgi:hypothetical protein